MYVLRNKQIELNKLFATKLMCTVLTILTYPTLVNVINQWHTNEK